MAPVDQGAIGGAEVFDVPQATDSLETGMLTGGEVVVDSEVAFTADGEVGTEGMTMVSDLDDEGLGVRRLSDGAIRLAGHGGHDSLPSFLLLLGDVFPGRERCGKRGAVGFVGSPGEAFNEGGHISIMPERVWPWRPGNQR